MRAGAEFGRGWPIVSAAAVGIGLGLSPLPFYTIGVFIGPLAAEFGWTVQDVLYALPVYTVGAFLMSPLIGYLADRAGARRVALFSIVGFGLAMMSMSLNTGSKALYVLLWSLLSVFGAGTLPITFTRAVNNWFDHNRGLALGMALIATGMFGTLAKYAAAEVVGEVGWRTAYLVVGSLPILIAFPIALLGFRDLRDTPAKAAAITKAKGLLMIPPVLGLVGLWVLVLRFVWPQVLAEGLRLQWGAALAFLVIVSLPVLAYVFGRIGTEPPVAKTLAPGESLPGDRVGEAVLSWRFGLLAVCFVCISYGVGAPIPNIEQILGASGFDAREAVGLAGLTGLAVLGGRLIGGALIDRFWAPLVAFVFLASPSVALWMLAQGDVSQATATVAILMIGFGAGVEYDFLAYLVSKYFGMRSYSAIYGCIYGFFAIGAGFGPIFMTRNLAETGWGPPLQVAAVVLFVASVPLLFLGRYKYGHDGERR
jgi:MFS family permease